MNIHEFSNFFASQYENQKVLITLLAIFISGISGYCIVYFYQARQKSEIKTSDFQELTKLIPILTISLTVIFSSLQLSIPLSLGLLGSLSIIRFRTPIKNPYDVSLIISAITIALLSSTNNFVLALLFTIIYCTVIIIQNRISLKDIKARQHIIISNIASTDSELLNTCNEMLLRKGVKITALNQIDKVTEIHAIGVGLGLHDLQLFNKEASGKADISIIDFDD